MCKIEKGHEPTYNITGKIYVLATSLHKVNGYGYECTKQITIEYNEENFFTSKFKTTNNKFVPLSRDDCADMVTTKKCENMLMTCGKNECTVRIENLNKFEWMKTTESRVARCSVKIRKIMAVNF